MEQHLVLEQVEQVQQQVLMEHQQLMLVVAVEALTPLEQPLLEALVVEVQELIKVDQELLELQILVVVEVHLITLPEHLAQEDQE
tara:strand:- start:258 stop:512 length:255 start_codon:yes stop_codon:yes gene_type:complete